MPGSWGYSHPGDVSQFDIGILAFGALLVLGGILAGLGRRSFLSLTAVFVLVGFLLGNGGLGLISLDAQGSFVEALATVALVVILFRDGLEVDEEMLRGEWRLPMRKLVVAMPLTAAVVAVGAWALTDLDWTEAFLLGALLSPTDPVLSSSVVTNHRVPRLVRGSLNLESGMNDGLALPAVLALLAALGAGGEGEFVWWRFVLQDISLGLLTGVVMGWLGAHLMPRDTGLHELFPTHDKAIYALGIAFATYGVAVGPPHGNGLIAVFTAAIVLGILRPDIREAFESRSTELVEVVKLGIFVVFGSLLTLEGLAGEGLGGLAIVALTLFVARPLAIFIACAGTATDLRTRAFMGWFGPKGVATMTFSLLVLSAGIADGERIFHVAALAVFCSIILHGFTDTPGANWIAAHAERRQERRGDAALPARP
jgi:NhaP-type Na+/H+ or K+/H+ antiporter